MTFRPTPTLRGRLLASYGALAIVTTLLASGAATTLFGRQLDGRARRELTDSVTRLAEQLEADAAEAPWRPVDILLDRRLRQRRLPGFVLLVDEEGRRLSGGRRGRLGPPGPGLDEGSAPGADAPSESARGAGSDRAGAESGRSRRAGFGRGRDGDDGDRHGADWDHVLLPPDRSGDETPRIALATFPGRDGRPDERHFYATAPVPTLGSYLDPPRAAYVAVVRPAREVGGHWRGLVPPIGAVGLATLTLSGLLALALAGSISRPIVAVTRASERMAAGDYSVRVPVTGDAETARLALAFNAMAERVGEVHARQRDFVANVGHDLRTPLTAIQGFAEALRDGTAKGTAQRAAALDAILDASGRMNTLVESLLDLARLEGRAAGFDRRVVPARTLLADAREACRSRAGERGTEIVLAADDAPEAWVDPKWLTRAVVNLLENAIVYGPEGGTVTLAAAQARDETGRAVTRLSIEDEGPGIPPDVLPDVFERFYRGDPARAAGGTGLGLSIAREIVAAHDGRIVLEPAVGGGTRAVIDLPAGPSAAHDER